MPLPTDSTDTAASGPPPARYKPINTMAVVSIVLGVLSAATALHWAFAVVPLAGIVCGWVAIKQIGKAPDEWIGLPAAHLGIVLSAAMWIFGYGWLIFVQADAVPAGYRVITFDMLQPDPMKPTEPIPETARELDDAKVFMRGYIQARRTQTGIKDFILCKSNCDCPVCVPDARQTELIRVHLQGDLTTNYTSHMISVSGRFRINMLDNIPYAIEADRVH